MRQTKRNLQGGNRGTSLTQKVHCLVTSSPNNTKVVRTWRDPQTYRRVNRVYTAGSRGYKNTKRGSTLAAQEVRLQAGKAFLELGKGSDLHRRRRGIGRGRVQAITEFESRGIHLVTVSDVTKNPHNGCRRKKSRRI